MSDSILESPEDVLSTLTREGKRKWIYPIPSQGHWYKLRAILGWFLIALYVLIPHLRIYGKPAFLLDIFGGRFIILGVTFFATDNLILLFFAFTVAFGIVAITALFGRAWCGWACPQTVYLEFVFRPIERFFEGSENARRKLDDSPLTVNKFVRKMGKYSAFLAVSFVLANTFVAYFVGSDKLLLWMQSSPVEHPGPFMLMIAMTGAIMFDFCYFREQMCTIACPYARLQSVMLDHDSLLVIYDESRGEPRGKGKARSNLGHCINCNMCVKTCPTGIDIRQGLQMECLHCTQCIDACDAVMAKVHLPLGLIRLSSRRELEEGKTRWLRPRTVVYSIICSMAVSAFIYTLATREATDLRFLRRSTEPYSILPNGNFSNYLLLEVHNRSDQVKNYTISGNTSSGLTYIFPESHFAIKGGESKVISLFVSFAKPKYEGAAPVAQVIVAETGGEVRKSEMNLVYQK